MEKNSIEKKEEKKRRNLKEKMEMRYPMHTCVNEDGFHHNENESESKIQTIFNHVRTCFYYDDKYDVNLDSDGVAAGGEERREGRCH